MRILIIGAGAVGSFIGARSALAGHDVTLVGRRALAEAVQAGGLTLIEPDGARTTANVHAVDSIAAAFIENKPGFSEKPGLFSISEKPGLFSSFDLALITVKAFDTAQVIAELAHGYGDPAPTADPPKRRRERRGVG